MFSEANNQVYHNMKLDLLQLDGDKNEIDRTKVKESDWPIELFYNKTVNTFKKK